MMTTPMQIDGGWIKSDHNQDNHDQNQDNADHDHVMLLIIPKTNNKLRYLKTMLMSMYEASKDKFWGITCGCK